MWLEIKRGGMAGIDRWAGEWGIFTLILLVALGSFGLGRLSVITAPKPLVSISEASMAAAGLPMAPGGQYVASRTGEVYYYPWCAGAKQILPQNQRWFATEEAAKAAGYRPAKNCKGLVVD